MLRGARERSRQIAAARATSPMPPPPAVVVPARLASATETAEQAAERIERQRDVRRRTFLMQADVPKLYASASLDARAALPADADDGYGRVALLLRRMMSEPVILALCGRRGTGKTYLACAAVRESCLALRPARYATTAGYFSELRSQYRPGGDEARAEAGYEWPKLLVLDEVQERAETEFEQRKLTRLIDRRYAERRTTILISNQTKREFQESVGESIVDRIADGGGFIECNWASLRGRMPVPDHRSSGLSEVRT